MTPNIREGPPSGATRPSTKVNSHLTWRSIQALAEGKNHMVDRKLVALIAAGTLLSLGHNADHVIRDDLHWPSTELLVFVIVGLLLYGAIGVSLYL